MRQRLTRTKTMRFLADDSGQDVVEYGLLVAVISMVVLIGVSAFGAQIEPWFVVLAARITTAGT